MRVELGCDPCPRFRSSYRSERVHAFLGERVSGGQRMRISASACCFDSVTCPALDLQNGQPLPALTMKRGASENQVALACDPGYSPTSAAANGVSCSEEGWRPIPACCNATDGGVPECFPPETTPTVAPFDPSSCRRLDIVGSRSLLLAPRAPRPEPAEPRKTAPAPRPPVEPPAEGAPLWACAIVCVCHRVRRRLASAPDRLCPLGGGRVAAIARRLFAPRSEEAVFTLRYIPIPFILLLICLIMICRHQW